MPRTYLECVLVSQSVSQSVSPSLPLVRFGQLLRHYQRITTVMGDLHGQVGQRNEGCEHVIGHHGIGQRNEAGDMILNFCNSNGM